MGRNQLRLDGDEDRTVALAQYDTPPELAARQVAMIEDGLPWGWGSPAPHVLEPSAGCGALVRALLRTYPRATVHAVELDPARARALHESLCDGTNKPSGRAQVRIECVDYLERPAPSRRYDIGLSNPPFTAGVEEAHIVKLMRECDRVVVQLPIRALHGKARTHSIWSQVGKLWHVRQEVRVAERVYPNASDDIILLDLRREPGPCRVEWWAR